MPLIEFVPWSAGSTRFVVLIGDYAIKFAKFRPFRPFVRMVEVCKKGEDAGRVLSKYSSNRLLAGFRYVYLCVFLSFIANAFERRYYKNHRNMYFLSPTIYSFIIFNIQRRGRTLDDSEVDRLKEIARSFRNLSDADFYDIFQPKNWVVIDNKIRCVDYPSKDVTDLLERLLSSGIEVS